MSESNSMQQLRFEVWGAGRIRVVSEAFGEVGDRLDTVGVGGRDQGHDVVADRGTVLALIIERVRHDQGE